MSMNINSRQIDNSMIKNIIVSMSSSETSEIFFFKEKNVTDFLERWKDICKNYKLNDIKRLRRLSRYCEKLIKNNIKFMKEFEEED